MDYLVRAVLIGVDATVGRWLAYMPRGRFRHDPIAATPPACRPTLGPAVGVG